MPRRTLALVALVASFTTPGESLADPAELADPAAGDAAGLAEADAVADPDGGANVNTTPRLDVPFLHYGVGLSAESVVDPGEVCPSQDEGVPCILGSGFGLTLRAGYRPQSLWYVGGAYTVSRQDSSNLLRLGILQQLRFELRRYLAPGRRATPYIAADAGVVAYGDEWGVSSGGPILGVGLGLEVELTQQTVVGLRLLYRPAAFVAFTDGAGLRRADGPGGLGVAHLLSIELLLEPRVRLSRW